MNKRTGIIKDKRYFHHKISEPSPENPNRIKNLYLTLDGAAYTDKLIRFNPREATSAEVSAIHSDFYLDQIRDHALATNPFSYDRDTYLMDESIYTAHLAAGGCLELADRIMNDEIDNGFGLIRPPGHHAEPGRGMGFCILNNVAIVAAYLQKKYGLSRILIFDFDVHHGNGTQEAFYDTNEVLFVSFHQHNLFPFGGGADEVGKEKGLGYTVNMPIYSQFGDVEYTNLTGKVIGNLVEQYMPQFILVSAGFDGHAEDTISDTVLSTAWFGTVTNMLKKYAEETCINRLLYVLEGGYNPEILEQSVLASLDALMVPVKPIGIPQSARADRVLLDHPMHTFWSL